MKEKRDSGIPDWVSAMCDINSNNHIWNRERFNFSFPGQKHPTYLWKTHYTENMIIKDYKKSPPKPTSRGGTASGQPGGRVVPGVLVVGVVETTVGVEGGLVVVDTHGPLYLSTEHVLPQMAK